MPKDYRRASPRKVKVVSAVGVASGSLSPQRRVKSTELEAAMKAAVEQCIAEGVPLEDVATYKARIAEARARLMEG